MKIRTVLTAGIAAGIGYILGTAAGRARFEQIRGKATDFLGSPQVQDTVANLSDTVKQNASKLPGPVAGVVNTVADKAKGAAGGQETSDPAPSTSDLPETSMSDLPETSSMSDLPETSPASDPLESSFAADSLETPSEPVTSFTSDPLETSFTSEPETPFASDLPETSSDSDPLETAPLSDPETPLVSSLEPSGSDLTDADDPLNPTTPPSTPPQ